MATWKTHSNSWQNLFTAPMKCRAKGDWDKERRWAELGAKRNKFLKNPRRQLSSLPGRSLPPSLQHFRFLQFSSFGFIFSHSKPKPKPWQILDNVCIYALSELEPDRKNCNGKPLRNTCCHM